MKQAKMLFIAVSYRTGKPDRNLLYTAQFVRISKNTISGVIMILHITARKDWENAQINGEYTASSLTSDGFIHCSTLTQTIDTANIFFNGQKGLVLLCIDENKLKSEIRYEDPTKQHDPRVDKLFPHVYGPINNSAVIQVVDFPSDEQGLFTLPNDLPK